MSRRTHWQDADDALELFLDAMSNMFGGVVFIAVTVIILLQFTARPTAPDTADVRPPQETEPHPEIESLRIDVAKLQRVLDSTTTASDPDNTANQLRLSEVMTEYEAANAALHTQRRDTEALHANITQAQRRAKETVDQRELIHAELLETRAALEDATAHPPQRLRVPRYRATAKREFPVLLSGGRLVNVFESASDREFGQVNDADLAIDRHSQTVRARPGRGTPIDARPDSRTFLVAQFKQLDPAQDYVSLAVWPDSFDAALSVRDTLIDLGFEYGLTFIEADAGVPFKAASGVQ
ncbi:MAG: hypothetical protein AAF333_04415 [Planctomycetota bacterium]